MADKEHKLAVMGATGAGKTIFLTSYFKYVSIDGEGKYSIRMTDAESQEKVKKLIKELFVDKKALTGTSERYNMGFAVSELNMDVKLDDLPGGYTTNPKDWEPNEIAADLKTADGVLFFIPIDSLYRQDDMYYESYLQSIQVFSMAVALLRQDSDGLFRQDVPVCVLFTKGDINPSAQLEELESLYSSFLNNLKSSTKRGFFEKWFKKGKNVRCWKTTSMGRWLDNNTPPSEDEHENVVEPMEWMFETMQKARSHRTKTFTGLLSFICAAVFVFASISFFLWDKSQWSSLQNSVSLKIEEGHFEEALAGIEDYQNRFYRQLPLTVSDATVVKFKKEINQNSLSFRERKQFAVVLPYIEGVDWTQFPINEIGYYDKGVQQLQKYLSITDANSIAPDHYKQAREALPYWTLCRELRTFTTEPAEGDSLGADEYFNRLNSLLNIANEAPAWRDRISAATLQLFTAWVTSTPSIEQPNDAEKLISKGNALLQHDNLDEKLQSAIMDKITNWKEAQKLTWQRMLSQWLEEAAGMKPADAAKFLYSKKLQNALPQSMSSELNSRIDMLWTKARDEWIETARQEENLQEAKSYLESKIKSGSLPDDVLVKLRDEVDSFNSRIVDQKMADLRHRALDCKDISELADNAISEYKTFIKLHPKRHSEAQRIIDERLRGLFQDEMEEIQERIDNHIFENYYLDARHTIYESNKRISSSLQKLSIYLDISDYEKKLSEHMRGVKGKLFKAELKEAKREFQKLINLPNCTISDINKTIGRLRNFSEEWRGKPGASEAQDVIKFIEKVSKGLPMDVIFEGYSCNNLGWFQGNEIYAKVYHKGKELFRTKTYNSNKINKAGIYGSINWKLSTYIKVELYEDDYTGDKRIMEGTFKYISLLGFEELKESKTVYGKNYGCSATISGKLTASSVPKIPEGWR